MSGDNLNIKYQGYIGVDEVARGNLFGPVLFVGVDLKVPYTDLNFVVDSKKTNKKQRKDIFNKIVDKVDFYLVEISSSKIDNYGLSSVISMALNEIINHFNGKRILYDGNSKFGVTYPLLETEIAADNKVVSVSCASIIAKYNLDIRMEQYDKLYPEYNLLSNSGYGTKSHIDAIKKFGYTELHRKSYKIKELNVKNNQNSHILF